MKKIFTLILTLISLGVIAQTFTWGEQNSTVSASLNDVFFADNMNGWAVGDNGTIVATTDGGTTWMIQSGNTDQPLRAVFFIDANTGWISGGNLSKALLKTTDGGAYWQDIAPANVPNQLLDIGFIDANTGWMVADSIYKTTDGGITWIAQTISTSVSQTSYRVLTVPTDSTAYVGGASKRASPSNVYADVFSSALSPTSSVDFMSSVGSIKTTDPGIRSIDHATPNIIFAGGTAGAIYKMEFQGQNNNGPWEVNLDLNPVGGSQFIISISFPTEANGMFLTENSGALVYHTADTGNTWNMTPDTIAGLSANALHAPDANNAWVVGTSGKIYMGTRINTAISNRDLSLDVRVYPNPATDRVNVMFNSKITDLIEYQLWDISGRVIRKGQISIGASSSTFSINISDIKNGSYLLNMNSDSYNNTFHILKK